MLTKFENKSARVKGLSFHPKRPWVLTSLHNGSVQIWDYRMGMVVDTYTEHEGPVRGCAFHPSQPLFATCGDDNKVRVFNFQQKRSFELTGHQDYVRTVSFHHESPWLLTASDDQTIRVWNWQSRTCIATLTGHSHYVMCAQFHPRDDLVVSASLDQTIRVWDISHLKRRGSMTPAGDEGRGGQIDLFASSDGQVKFVMEGHDRGVNWVQFHPTKPMIVSGSDDRSVKLWRYNESRAWETDTFRGHFNNVSCCLFHPTQDLILSASEDKTVRVWDYSKRGLAAQTFRRDTDRYWMLAVHPTLGLFAAGHDSGFQVFKMERERPAQLVIEESLFFLRGATLIRKDLGRASTSETTLVTLGQKPALPALLDYSSPDKAFLISHGSEWELVSRASRKGLGSNALFIGQGRFIVLERAEQTLVVKSTSDGSNLATIPSPIAGLEKVFPAPDNCLLLSNGTAIALFDLSSQAILCEAKVPKVKRASWSLDGSRLAVMSRKAVHLFDHLLAQIGTTCVEQVAVKSGVWDASEPSLFHYTTPHHLKYLLPSGESGIICALEQPLYLVRVHGSTVQALDREAQLTSLTIDPAEYNFKLALLDNDLPRVTQIIQESTLVGQSVISYLRHHGHSSLALHFVDDADGRFELALECAQWPVAMDAAAHLDQTDVWEALAKQARKLGNPAVAKEAYSRAGNHSDALMMAAITGDKARMSSSLGSAADISTRLQSAILLGDSYSLAKSLEEAGLDALAHLAHLRSGSMSSIKVPSTADLPKPKTTGQLSPVQPFAGVADSAWPLSQPLCEYELPSPPPLPSSNAHTLDLPLTSPLEAGWEDDIRLAATQSLDHHHDQDDDEFTDFADVTDNPLLSSKIPVLHLLAGSVESGKRLMSLQAGIVDFTPLQPFFDLIAQRTSLGTLLNRFEDVSPVLTLTELQEHLDLGLQLTTEGRFPDAISAFEWILHAAPFTLLPGPADNPQLLQDLIQESREYLVGLKMELTRKELIASAGGELSGDLATRVLELACYFTCCRLRPIHLTLALRSAMTLSFKLKQISLSARMAKRLLDLHPSDAIAAQAQKVIAAASKSTPTGPLLDIEYDDHLDFDVDPATYSPLYLGQPAISCPHCGASYHPSEKATVCRVCRVAAVGAQATGLQLSL